MSACTGAAFLVGREACLLCVCLFEATFAAAFSLFIWPIAACEAARLLRFLTGISQAPASAPACTESGQSVDGLLISVSGHKAVLVSDAWAHMAADVTTQLVPGSQLRLMPW